MSASIYAEPLERKKDYIPISAPNSFMDDLEKVFGSKLPILTADDVIKLRVVFVLGKYDNDALKTIEHLIENHGPIQLSAEY